MNNKLSIIALLMLAISSCTADISDRNDSDINIGTLISSVETKLIDSKQSAIDDIIPALDFASKKLDAVCDEISGDKACQNELAKIRKQINQIKQGELELEDLPSMSLEEIAFLSAKYSKG